MPSNHLILCHPFLLPPSIFPSIRVFSNEPAPRIRWPKYWGFSFSISPSNEYSGWISLRIDWFDLLAVQRTLQNLLQHHDLKASMLWCSAFLTVQLSHRYMPTGKPQLSLDGPLSFVGKVMLGSIGMLISLSKFLPLLNSSLLASSPVLRFPEEGGSSSQALSLGK